MRKCIYPGSFDPFTSGHLDVLIRASALFDDVTVTLLTNSAKKMFFSLEERMDYIRCAAAGAGLGNVRVDSFDGLTVEYARRNDIKVIIRGLRAVSDYEYEVQIAHANKMLAPEIETVFLMADARYSYFSSSIVREIGSHGGDISACVPPVNHNKIRERLLTK